MCACVRVFSLHVALKSLQFAQYALDVRIHLLYLEHPNDWFRGMLEPLCVSSEPVLGHADSSFRKIGNEAPKTIYLVVTKTGGKKNKKQDLTHLRFAHIDGAIRDSLFEYGGFNHPQCPIGPVTLVPLLANAAKCEHFLLVTCMHIYYHNDYRP